MSIVPSRPKLWLWGENGHGELSTGDENDVRLPQELTSFAARHNLAQLSLGLHHSVALSLSNDVFTAGSWISGLLGHEDRSNVHKLKKLRQFADLKTLHPNNPIVAIACGDRHSVALHASGQLYTWGGTLYGKLGRAGDSHNTYYLVTALEGQRVTFVDCGNWHTAVSTDQGEVYTFGGGGKHFNKGALGTGDTEDSLLPRKVPMFGSRIFVQEICCGGYHTMAVTRERQVYAWGRGDFGQLGLGHDNNETEPKLVEALSSSQVRSLAAGENHSLAALANGEVWSWGYGQQGQLGHGDGQNSNLPKRIEFFSQRNFAVVQVAAGWRHSVCLTVDGHVYSWGHGDRGQLGHGDTKSLTIPKVVDAMLGCDVRQIRAGGSHSLAFSGFFKAAQEMVVIQQERLKKLSTDGIPLSAFAINEEDKLSDSFDHLNTSSASLKSTHQQPNRSSSTLSYSLIQPSSRRSSQSEILANTVLHHSSSDFISPTHSNYASAFTQSDNKLCVEIVYTAQVSLAHRFITFQTSAAPPVFTPIIHTYIEDSYRNDKGTAFDNFIVSPGNIEPRSLHQQTALSDEHITHESNVYDYDAGPSRVTIMLVTCTLPSDENLWPEWASTLYDQLAPVCFSSQQGSLFTPCFRELRPQHLQQTIRKE